MSKKEIITRFGVMRDLSDLEGGIEDTIKMLLDLKTVAESQGFTNISLYLDVDNYSYSGGRVFDSWYIMGNRLETDEEYDKRMKREERIKQDNKNAAQVKLNKERREYERLKKKFENTVTQGDF